MDLPQDSLLALALFVFILGLRHGMDPDHIAAIDGLTRFNVQSRPRLARWAGCLFSLGHGAVVIVVALLAGAMARRWTVPSWLEAAGALTSAFFLLAFGLATLWALFKAPPGQPFRLRGLKNFCLPKTADHPAAIALVGALLALSFDTLSLAVLFAIAASSVAGWLFSGLLGALFMARMAVTDGLNGLWIERLLRRAGERTAAASRAMASVIGVLSIGVGIFCALRYLYPQLAVFYEGRELYFGAALVATTTLTYVVVGGGCRERTANSPEHDCGKD